MVSYDSEVTYQLRDLNDWRFPGTSLAVIGFPVRHSISPAMHNAAIADLAAKDSQFNEWAPLSLRGRTRETASSFAPIFRKGILWPKSYRTSQRNRFRSDRVHRRCSRRDWSGQYTQTSPRRIPWIQYRRIRAFQGNRRRPVSLARR